MTWPTAFALTLVIETPIYPGVLTLLLGALPLRRALGTSLVANLATHPALWFVVLPLLTPRLGAGPAIVLAEALVCAVEVLVVRRAGVPTAPAVAAAVLANASSWLVGMLVGGWLGA